MVAFAGRPCIVTSMIRHRSFSEVWNDRACAGRSRAPFRLDLLLRLTGP
ncbi:hypothetical protein OQ496_08715 [Acetobacter suratthaniensis]|nr:hypothetical protein [Acetobacter suratthaniensis]MCX2566539.1 hypothetical protein [Acetobacter suratthaniensis]